MPLDVITIARQVTTTAIVLQPQYLKKINQATCRDPHQIPLAMSALEVGRTPLPQVGRRTTRVVEG